MPPHYRLIPTLGLTATLMLPFATSWAQTQQQPAPLASGSAPPKHTWKTVANASDGRPASTPAPPGTPGVPLHDRRQSHYTRLLESLEQSLQTQAALNERLALLEQIQQTQQRQIAMQAQATEALVSQLRTDIPSAGSARNTYEARQIASPPHTNWPAWLLLASAGLVGAGLVHRVTSTGPAVRRPSGAPHTRDTRTPSSPAAKGAHQSHEDAVALAEIMQSFGRTYSATRTLAEYVQTHPRQSVTPWLRLLTLYYRTGRREDFETLATELNRTFNVRAIRWNTFDAVHGGDLSLEDFPHIAHTLVGTWHTRQCQAYIEHLVRDNRDGSRRGLPLGVIDELLVLAEILDIEPGQPNPAKP